jgi:hypothetical protein
MNWLNLGSDCMKVIKTHNSDTCSDDDDDEEEEQQQLQLFSWRE